MPAPIETAIACLRAAPGASDHSWVAALPLQFLEPIANADLVCSLLLNHRLAATRRHCLPSEAPSSTTMLDQSKYFKVMKPVEVM